MTGGDLAVLFAFIVITAGLLLWPYWKEQILVKKLEKCLTARSSRVGARVFSSVTDEEFVKPLSSAPFAILRRESLGLGRWALASPAGGSTWQLRPVTVRERETKKGGRLVLRTFWEVRRFGVQNAASGLAPSSVRPEDGSTVFQPIAVFHPSGDEKARVLESWLQSLPFERALALAIGGPGREPTGS